MAPPVAAVSISKKGAPTYFLFKNQQESKFYTKSIFKLSKELSDNTSFRSSDFNLFSLNYFPYCKVYLDFISFEDSNDFVELNSFSNILNNYFFYSPDFDTFLYFKDSSFSNGVTHWWDLDSFLYTNLKGRRRHLFFTAEVKRGCVIHGEGFRLKDLITVLLENRDVFGWDFAHHLSGGIKETQRLLEHWLEIWIFLTTLIKINYSALVNIINKKL